MDKLFNQGLSNVFLAISLNVVKRFDVSLLFGHLDSSSFHLHGEYNNNNNDKQISNLTEDRKYILNFLPSECYQYYQY